MKHFKINCKCTSPMFSGSRRHSFRCAMVGRASGAFALVACALLCARVHETRAQTYERPLSVEFRDEMAHGSPDGAWTRWLLRNARNLMVSLPKPLRAPGFAFAQRLLSALHQRAVAPLCVFTRPQHLLQRPRSKDSHLILLDDDEYLTDFFFSLLKETESKRADIFHSQSKVMFLFLHEYICHDKEEDWHTILRFASSQLSLFKTVWFKKNLGICAQLYPHDMLYFYDSFNTDTSLLPGLKHAPNTVTGVENIIRFHEKKLNGKGYRYMNVFHRNETSSLYHVVFNGRKYQGLAHYLLEYFTKKHNLSLGWLDASQFGAKYPGSACSIMMEFLSLGYTHLAPSECSANSEYLPFVEPINPMTIYKLKVIVPKGELIPPLSLLRYCFEKAVWVCTFASITVTTFAWYILTSRSSILTSAIDVLIIFSSASWLNLQHVSSSSQRLLVAVCLLTANVVLVTAFQSTLVSLLTSGVRYHPIETLEELVDSKMRLQMDMKYVKILSADKEMDATMKRVASHIIPKLDLDAGYELMNVVTKRDTALILPLTQTSSAETALPWILETVHVIHESLAVMALSYTHRSNSIFKAPFKAMVNSLFETGVIYALDQDLRNFVGVAMIRNPQSNEYHVIEKINKESGRIILVKPVSLKDTTLAFSLLFIGLLTSFLVFVSERLLQKYMKGRNKEILHFKE